MSIVEQQKKFFATGKTRDIEYRQRQLRSLYHVILQYQPRILESLAKDLSKSEQESYLTEVGQVLAEISYALRHLRRWCRPKRTGPMLAAPLSGGRVFPEPYGSVLILAPYNYPFALSMTPLVSALAAGNCAVIKPSELCPATSAILCEMINNNFEERLLSVIPGGPEMARSLLEAEFDYIFFTGSRRVGGLVYQQAAKSLVPVTLELGGKSPCIVEKSADIDAAARRIVWGKFLNAGQTCVAPDFLMVQDSVKARLVEQITHYITAFYSETPLTNENYPKIVNLQQYQRLCEMMEEGTVLFGGEKDEESLKIAPTLLENAPFYAKIMSEEIFGPLLPVIEFSEVSQIFDYISLHDQPLALYLFTKDRALQRRCMEEIQFGGGCINDTLLQVTTRNLPFGGIGASGIGSYHGEAGFLTFSHQKSVVKNPSSLDLRLRYPPYGALHPILGRLLK